jgi:hypothetical protein
LLRSACVCVVILIAVVGVSWLVRSNRQPEKPPLPAPDGTEGRIATAKAVLRSTEPEAVEARAAVIRTDSATIEAECQQAAGGDWSKWLDATAGFRAALKQRLEAVKFSYLPPQMGQKPQLEMLLFEPLAALDDFPLYEIGSKAALRYLCEPDRLTDFRKTKSVSVASRWLRRQGIDLVFVPVPRMTEVYCEHFIKPCPADGVIAPYLCQSFHELLREDVEVVDSFRIMRPRREPDPDYLHGAADTHWSARGARLVARQLAERMSRYGFIREARKGPRVVSESPDQTKPFPRNGWRTLNDEQKAKALRVSRDTPVVVGTDGRPAQPDPDGPVLLIGDSSAEELQDQLALELNLRLRTNWSRGQTTESFEDFLRRPELLQGVRVVVWAQMMEELLRFRPLPQSIRTPAE